MKQKTFTDTVGHELTISHRKSALFFSTTKEKREYIERFLFTPEAMSDLFDYLTLAADESWFDVTLKEATCMGNDYDEYYDRELDNNGSLLLTKTGLCFDRPSISNDRLFKFNKVKMQSLLYDLRKIVQE